MGIQQIRGNLGEFAGAWWLSRNGFRILQRNWRTGRKEIDIIAEKNGTLHIIEVKTRFSDPFGWPETAVSWKKIGMLEDAARQYMALHPYWKNIQFSVLSLMVEHNIARFAFFEDI